MSETKQLRFRPDFSLSHDASLDWTVFCVVDRSMGSPRFIWEYRASDGRSVIRDFYRQWLEVFVLADNGEWVKVV